jgi:DNA ligase-1
MYLLAPACEAIAATSKKLEKTRIVAEYLRSRTPEEAAVSAVFLSGRAFPAYQETTLQLGGTQLWRIVQELSGKSESAMAAAYHKYGDLGAAAYDVLAARYKSAPANPLNLIAVKEIFEQIARTRGANAKMAIALELLSKATPLEAKYLIKIMTGDLRIGMKESLVEEGIAKAYGATAREVQRANMLLGDIGETCRLAIEGRLCDARMRLFHPIGAMLATPVETAEEAFEFFQHAAVEDKYDGIRAQAHCQDGKVRLFSRTLDDVSESFPELTEALGRFSGELILDGEIVAWSTDLADAGPGESAERNGNSSGRALPFSELQKRLGRKKVAETLMRSVPVAYVAFDVLYSDGALVIDRPLHERANVLDRAFARVRRPAIVRTADPQGKLTFEPAITVEDEVGIQAEVIRAPVLRADSAQHLDKLFEAAQARGNEGLMIKDLESPYTPGRRGQSWLKLKRELATLDVVVTAVEYGHGKRAGVLSDYTFAVRSGERLVNIGKAYSGLTDKEIAEMTQWFLAHTLVDSGFVREVEPKIVLEVAFNAIMRSDRHESGFALRFPRIFRIRDDKTPEEIDTLETVEEIYQRQIQRAPG